MADSQHTLPTGPFTVIQSIIRNKGIENCKISVESAVPKGQNFTGAVYRVCVTGKEKNRDVKLNYIVKIASSDESDRSVLPLTEMYKRETLYYIELLPMYEQLQDEAKLPAKEQLKFAKCIHANNEYLNEYIILEDLKAKGYFPVERTADAEYNHALSALEAYGKLHAMSFVFKKRYPEKFDNVIRRCTEMLWNRSDWLTRFNRNAFRKAESVLEDDNCKDIFKGYENNIFDSAVEALKQNENSVLSHSDCWSTNLLYKYENEDVIDTCLIDFQLARYGPPAADVLHYIFTNTGHALRHEHYPDLLSAYHNAMKKQLKAFSYDIKDIYPWTKFEEDLQATSLYALPMSLGAMFLTFSDDDLTPNMNDFINMEKPEACKSEKNDVYKKRMQGIVKDFVKYGYLR